jgi:hypothetical protein
MTSATEWIFIYIGKTTRGRVSETQASTEDHGGPRLYEIRIEGHLADRWTDWLGGLTIMLEDNSETLLSGEVADQAVLHGLLTKVRDMGLPLISVVRVEPSPSSTLGTGQADATDVEQ